MSNKYLEIRVNPYKISVFIRSCILLFIMFTLSSETAAEMTGTGYKARNEIISLAGPGASSDSYDLENIVGVNTGNMSGSLYGMVFGLSAWNNSPLALVDNYNDSRPTDDETPTLQWVYSDADNDPQNRFQLQVARENFSSLVTDSGEVSSDATAYTTPVLPRTEERTVYQWRVRVYDGSDWSGWAIADNGFMLTSAGFLIPALSALTAPGGAVIEESNWQIDNDPYFYWEPPSGGLQVLGYSYALDGQPDDQVDTSGTYYYFDQDSISDGAHTFYVKAQRTSGLWGDASSFSIWVDTTAPTANTLQPTLGGVISTDIPELSAMLSDAASGVAADSIEMRVNQALVSVDYNAESGRVSHTPSIPLSEGEITVSLSIEDVVGNISLPLIWSFTVDTQGPTGSVLINNGDEMTTTNVVTLDITAEDDISDIAEMMLSNDGVFDTEGWETFTSLRKNWILPAITGTRKVYVKVRDDAGNTSDVFFDEISLVIVAPDTYILSGPSGITDLQTAQFNFSASLDNSQFSYKFDNDEWSEWSSDISISRSGISEGNHYFTVRAAKDLNQDGIFQLDEVDPTPAQRVWTISTTGLLKPPAAPEKPIKIWEEE